MKEIKTIMFFAGAHIRSQLSYKKFHFFVKNGILEIKFDNYQIYTKNQANKDRRICVKIMFRLKEMLRDACDYCKTL